MGVSVSPFVQVLHLAAVAGVQPPVEMVDPLWRHRRTDTDQVESQRPGLLFQPVGYGGRVHHSGSARGTGDEACQLFRILRRRQRGSGQVNRCKLLVGQLVWKLAAWTWEFPGASKLGPLVAPPFAIRTTEVSFA